jgi:DNA replication initiation complex subunit (GINS family)/energy-coupling factor transporter ATP-binding protein EcfA2
MSILSEKDTDGTTIHIDLQSGDVFKPAGQKDPTYLLQRMDELGITPEQNHYTDPDDHQFDLFDCDDKGNIIITYLGLNGKRIQWKKEDTKWPRYYQRTRLRQATDKQKYTQAKGSGQWPYFTLPVIDKYLKAEPIQTLVIVEGEFKAWKGSACGLHIIGIPSIHGFYNGDVRGKLHDDIQELIIKCQVQKIIFLVDADLLTLKWEANKDLAKRPESFYAAVKLFRESLQLLIDDENIALQNVCFMHLLTKFTNEAKGLDDLLVKYSAVHAEIIEDLLAFQFAKKYFFGKLINDPNKDLLALRQYLGLKDEQEFYKCYSEFIGAREFLFRNKRFEYNPEKKEVQFVRHEDADKYMRIGIDWLKIVKKPNKYGKLEDEMKPWSIGEIIRDYRMGKSADHFISQLLRFDDFCNEPNWNGEYKRVHNGCYNLCNPLNWERKAGSLTETIKLLKHIFQGKATIELNNGFFVKENPILGDQFTVILDWLTILFKHPKQMLPVPILVSKENGTGKSTFLKWLNQIFESNMVILGNDQFKMKFNMHYITKYIISIDEGFLDVDKKSEKERLKQMVTADRAFLEGKGMNVTSFNYYAKVIICSNDADNVMKIEDGESRWFVIKVPVVPPIQKTGAQLIEQGITKLKGEDVAADQVYTIPNIDPDLEIKMRNEIPAFLEFIHQREVFHPRVGRLWFDPEWFITDQMRIIVEQTKNRVDRVFEAWIKEQFLLFKMPILRYPLSYLGKVFNDPEVSKYRIDAIELKKYLTDKKKLEPKPVQRIKIPVRWKMETQQPEIEEISMIARPYEFFNNEWLSPEDMNLWSDPVITEPLEKIKFSNNDDKVPF